MQFFDSQRGFGITPMDVVNLCIYCLYIWVLEMGFRHYVTYLLSPVRFACKKETVVSHSGQYIYPFSGFKGHPICAREACGHETDTAWLGHVTLRSIYLNADHCTPIFKRILRRNHSMIDTQWPRFMVFQQEAVGKPFIHNGTVHAPDIDMALLNARDVFARRPQAVAMWVVPADSIFTQTREELANG